MALTNEQLKLRRKVLIRNANIENAEEFFDKMLQGGDFCLQQLTNWAVVFADAEVKDLRRKAREINEQADALEQAKALIK